jgi:hypothetical protein
MPRLTIQTSYDQDPTQRIPAALRALLEDSPMPGLSHSPQCKTTAGQIAHYLSTNPTQVGTSIEAALWLLCGELDRSHAVSQQIDTEDGAYWHGIMHRRERDFSNANYWFRRASKHPIRGVLTQRLKASEFLDPTQMENTMLFQAATVAEAITEGCKIALTSQPAQVPVWEAICWLELQLLLVHSLDLS